MWMLLPVICLAIVRISGSNVALIPDMAEVVGNDSYMMTVVIYIILGGIIATITAWIGIKSGLDLISVTKKLYGSLGKKVLAICLLSVSVPASALTGGYYAGKILQLFIGVPYWACALTCLILFSLLSVGHSHELLKLSNYIALLLIPILISVCFLHDFQFSNLILSWSHVNWLFILGLIGYSVGGVWTLLFMEIASHLSQKGNRGILLIVLAKVVEGIFTLIMAYLVLSAGAYGPLALADMVSKQSGVALLSVFYVVLFCVFGNTMVPAMLVNARQISNLTGLSFWPALLLATSIVYQISFLNFSLILIIMGYTSILMILFIIYTAYFLHKHGLNQQ